MNDIIGALSLLLGIIVSIVIICKVRAKNREILNRIAKKERELRESSCELQMAVEELKETRKRGEK